MCPDSVHCGGQIIQDPCVAELKVRIRASQVVLVIKNPPATAGDMRDSGFIPGSGRSPGGGNDNPLQCSCLENFMDRGAWRATAHGIAKSQTQLKGLSMHARPSWGAAKYNPGFKSAWAGLKSCVWGRRTWLHQPSSWGQFQGPLCQSASHQGSEVWDPRPSISLGQPLYSSQAR